MLLIQPRRCLRWRRVHHVTPHEDPIHLFDMWASAVRSAMFVPGRAASLAPRASLFSSAPPIAQRVRFSSTNVANEAEEEPRPTSAGPLPIRYPYFVSRVGVNGMNLPVYTDIRNARSRYLTNIRKVEGDATVRFFFTDPGALPRLV